MHYINYKTDRQTSEPRGISAFIPSLRQNSVQIQSKTDPVQSKRPRNDGFHAKNVGFHTNIRSVVSAALSA